MKDLHDLELAAEDAAGVRKAEQFVGRLGPAVEVVGQGQFVRKHHLLPALGNERVLVPVGGVVGTRHGHAPDACLEGRAVDVPRHRHVLEFHVEGIDATLAAGAGALVAEVHHGVHACEVSGVPRPLGVDEVGHFDAGHPVAGTILGTHVEHAQVVAVCHFVAQLRGDVAACAGEQHGLGHSVTPFANTRYGLSPCFSYIHVGGRKPLYPLGFSREEQSEATSDRGQARPLAKHPTSARQLAVAVARAHRRIRPDGSSGSSNSRWDLD